MSCQSGVHRGRKKVQVVNNDVAPECGLSSFIVRKLMLEIDCSLCFLFCRHGWRSEVRSPLSRFTPPGCVSCRNSTRKRTREAPIMASDAAPENGLLFSLASEIHTVVHSGSETRTGVSHCPVALTVSSSCPSVTSRCPWQSGVTSI